MLSRPDGGGLALHRCGSDPHRGHPSTADSHSTIISTITRSDFDRKEVTPLDSGNEQVKAEERRSSEQATIYKRGSPDTDLPNPCRSDISRGRSWTSEGWTRQARPSLKVSGSLSQRVSLLPLQLIPPDCRSQPSLREVHMHHRADFQTQSTISKYLATRCKVLPALIVDKQRLFPANQQRLQRLISRRANH
ncbi:hypothetical protein BDV97DRAFT_131449 [Delphinella strobiligena]|nr:hypothetical protein BDV97DRAFT_131449 [Delphinella strobiligena]